MDGTIFIEVIKIIKFYMNMISTTIEKELTMREGMMKNGDTRMIESMFTIGVDKKVNWSNIEGEDMLLWGMSMVRSSMRKVSRSGRGERRHV